MAKTGRNEMCPCGSGLKFKYCHGDSTKLEACSYAAKYRMAELIVEEKIKRGLVCKHGVPKGEHCKDCKVEGN